MKYAICYCCQGDACWKMEMTAFSVRKFIGDDIPEFCLTDCYWKPRVRNIKVLDPVKGLRDCGVKPYGWSRPIDFGTMFQLSIPLSEELYDYDCVVFLDYTTLVTSADARKILEGEIERLLASGKEAMAAKDIVPGCTIHNSRAMADVGDRASRALSGLWKSNNPYSRFYCNTGVVLYNMHALKKNGIDWFKKRVSMFWLRELRAKFELLMQDFINIFLDLDTTLDRRLDSAVVQPVDGACITNYILTPVESMRHAARCMGYSYIGAMCKEIPEYPVDLSDKKQLVLYISHIVNDETIWRYRKLASDTKGMNIDVLWCRNRKSPVDPKLPDDVRAYEFTDDEMNADKNYLFLNEGKEVPTQYNQPQWLLLTLSEKMPEYDYYWQMEYDNVYIGKWSAFFKTANRFGQDLVCNEIFDPEKSSGWPAWELATPDPYNDLSEALVSISSMCRISRRMCARLREYYNKYGEYSSLWFELAYTSLAINEFSIISMADIGIYCGWPKLDRHGMMYAKTKANTNMSNIMSGFGQSDAASLMRKDNNYSGFVEFLKFVDSRNHAKLKWVEIGSFSGESAELTVNNCEISKLWCIDPWTPFSDGAHLFTLMAEAEDAFDERASRHSDTIVKLKGTFKDFVGMLKDEHVDVVYIDANHEYAHVADDIRIAKGILPEIAISGHDYGLPGVKKAVDEAFGKPDKTFPDNSWIVFRNNRW